MIRPATAMDAVAIHTLIKQGIQGATPNDSSWIAERMERPSTVVLVTLTQKKIVGAIVGHVVLDEAEIHDVVIESPHRQSGKGSAIVQAFEVHVAQLGATHCFLEVRKSNEPAKNLYAKLGYTTTSVRQDYYSNGEDALLMRKDLGTQR